MNTNKVVLVTGTTSGFGRLISETLARKGYQVYASMRHSTGKNQAAAEHLVSLARDEALDLHVIDLDVTDDSSIQQAVAKIVTDSGRLDVVVNNAGVVARGPLEASTDEQISQLFNTNVFGVIRVNRAVLPTMCAQGEGLLIQVGSVLGRAAMPFFGAYSATKFALEGLTEAFNYELRGLSSGVEAIIIEPGTYPTELAQKRIESSNLDRLEPYAPFLAQMGSLQKLTMAPNAAPPDPQEVADKVAELIAMPAGSRPLRTVTAVEGQREGAMALNQVSEQVADSIANRLGLATVSVKSS